MEKRRTGATAFCKRLRVIVNFLRAEAAVFRTLGSDYENSVQIDRLGQVLRYVKNSTGKPHDETMADLLQATYVVLGVEEEFSAPKLRKLRQRKFPDIVHPRTKTPVLGGLDAFDDLPADWLGLMLGASPHKLDKKPRKK
jgi:hypothetical protein